MKRDLWYRMPHSWDRWEPWRALSPVARDLYTHSLVKASAANLLDGRLNGLDVHRACEHLSWQDAQRAIDELVAVGLAERDDGDGLYLPRWQEHHESAAKVAQVTEAKAAAGRARADDAPRSPDGTFTGTTEPLVPDASTALVPAPLEAEAEAEEEEEAEKGWPAGSPSDAARAAYIAAHGGLNGTSAKWLGEVEAQYGTDAVVLGCAAIPPGHDFLRRLKEHLAAQAERRNESKRDAAAQSQMVYLRHGAGQHVEKPDPRCRECAGVPRP